MAGSFFGALLNGIMIKRIGFRWSMIVGMIMMIAFPFLSVFGTSVELQTVGQALCGSVNTPSQSYMK
jgi:MFS transporter, SP family, general alpha glucoside:H+ symporter